MKNFFTSSQSCKSDRSSKSKRNGFFYKIYVSSLLIGGLVTMVSFQNCAKPTSIRLTDQASTAPTPLPLPEVLPNAGENTPQSKVAESFDASVPSSIVVDQGQVLQELQVELIKTGIGESKFVLKESTYNQQTTDLGMMFDRNTSQLQKQNKKVSLKNINTSTPGTTTLLLTFQVMDASGKVVNTMTKRIAVTVRSKTGTGAVVVSAPVQPKPPVTPSAPALPQPPVVVSAPVPVCGTTSITARLIAVAKFFDADIKLQGATSQFALPGPGYTTKYTLQFFKANGSVMTISELNNCSTTAVVYSGYSYENIRIDRTYYRRRNDGSVFRSERSMSFRFGDFSVNSYANTIEYTGDSWGVDKVSIQTSLGQIDATSNPIYSIPDCNVYPSRTMSVNASGVLGGTVTEPSSSFSNIDRNRSTVVVYHCGAHNYQYCSNKYNTPVIEFIGSKIYCTVRIGSSSTKDYYVRFMYFNSVGDPQCISSEYTFTTY